MVVFHSYVSLPEGRWQSESFIFIAKCRADILVYSCTPQQSNLATEFFFFNSWEKNELDGGFSSRV